MYTLPMIKSMFHEKQWAFVQNIFIYLKKKKKKCRAGGLKECFSGTLPEGSSGDVSLVLKYRKEGQSPSPSLRSQQNIKTCWICHLYILICILVSHLA